VFPKKRSQNKSHSGHNENKFNEYLFRLVCADLSGGESHISKPGNEFTKEHQKMLNKW
jgi:hypothetical protein